jgi:hypothetical protein
VRDDETKDSEFRESEVWNNQRYREELFLSRFRTKLANDKTMEGRNFVSNSLSGNERNRMYLGGPDGFTDVTLVSGTDDLSDGRSFGLIDFDQDGWLDIVLMTLNRPRLKLFRNDLAERFRGNQPLRFQLVGGQQSASPSGQLSNRDGVGAKILISFKSGKTLMMHRQTGEGFASQNTRTLQIGCPADDKIVSLKVLWPSGKTTQVDAPELAKTLKIFEVPPAEDK